MKNSAANSELAMANPSDGGIAGLWRNLSYCWRDPDAPPDTANAHRSRQRQALLQQAPVTAFDCAACSLIDIIIFWHDASHQFLLAWCGLVWLLSVISVAIWARYRNETDATRCAFAARSQTTVIAISGALFAFMLAYLIDLTDLTGKILLTAFFGTTMAHGAFHNARWPWAGALWGLGMAVVGGTTLLYFYGERYQYLALLAGLYSLSIVVSVLITSRLFVRSLILESESNRQKELIGLLLDDFEAGASDWLLETDHRGELRHISPRMASVLGQTAETLQGRSIVAVLQAALGNEAQDRKHLLNFEAALQAGNTFRDIELPLAPNGNLRWWALSGKPLLDAAGHIGGWRGVATEFTAERQRQQTERELQASREAAARIAGELDAARRIQIGLLPPLAETFAGETRFSVAAILEPAREIGGDYYECFKLDERRICLAVADVSGKGVPASLFMAMTKALITSMAQYTNDLGQTVSDVARELDRNNPEMLFVTAFIAVLDIDTGQLDFVSAGHDAPILMRDGEATRIELGEALGPPMCSLPGYAFRQDSMTLNQDDALCLYTDGITEASNGSAIFGPLRTCETLASLPPGLPVSSSARVLRDRVRDFEAGLAPADDLTILILRWHGPQSGNRPAPPPGP